MRAPHAPVGAVPLWARTLLRVGRGAALLVLLGALNSGLWLLALQPAPEVVPLRVGFQRSTFQDVNPSDLVAAFKIWTQAVAKKYNWQVNAEVTVFDNVSALEVAVKKGALHLAILGSWDYLEGDLGRYVDPAFVHIKDNRALGEYLVLTKRGSGLNSLRDLKGRDLLLAEKASGLLSSYWLDVLLADEHLGSKEAFFHKIEVRQKATAVVLPVFFGNSPACVVDRSTYSTLVEMNPQIGAVLQAVAVSPAYLNSITCMSKGDWSSEPFRKDFMKAIRELSLTPEGRQILLLFKIERLEPFTEKHLKSVLELYQKHKQLPGKGKS